MSQEEEPQESSSSSPAPLPPTRRKRGGALSNPRRTVGARGTYKLTKETTEIYRIPKQDEETEAERTSPIILKPAEWAIQLIAYNLNILFQIFDIVIRAFNSFRSAVSEPVHMTVQAKDRAREAMTQNLAMISQVPPKVTEGGGIVLRKLGFGCLAATYVCTMLTVLMLFALLVGFVFVTLWVEEPVIIRKTLYFDYTQPNPTAVVEFVPSDGVPVGAGKSQQGSGRRTVPAGHQFSASVILVMPESEHNRQIGMFQVMAELISGSGMVLARFSHPCMLPFRSAPLWLARTFLMGLPLLMGILGETQTVVIHLIDYQERIIPTESLKFILQPKAGALGLPELYSANVVIRSQLPWTKEFTRNWKWTFFVWSTLTFFFLLVGLIICCCKQVLLLRSTTAETDNMNLGTDGEELHSTRTDSRMSERGRRHSRSQNRHVSFVQDLPSISLQHSSMPLAAECGEQGEKSEIIEEYVADGKSQIGEDSVTDGKSEIVEESVADGKNDIVEESVTDGKGEIVEESVTDRESEIMEESVTDGHDSNFSSESLCYTEVTTSHGDQISFRSVALDPDRE